MKTIRLPGCWPIKIDASLAHWRREGTKHGPKSMPRIMAILWCKLDTLSGKPHPEWSGRRLWLYFRGGYAFCADFIIDRRGLS